MKKDIAYYILNDPEFYDDAVITSIALQDETSFIKTAQESDGSISSIIKTFLSKLPDYFKGKYDPNNKLSILDSIQEGLLYTLIPGKLGFIIPAIFSLFGFKLSDVLSKAVELLKGLIKTGKDNFSLKDIENIATMAIGAGSEAAVAIADVASDDDGFVTKASLEDAVAFRILCVDFKNHLIKEADARGSLLSKLTEFLKPGSTGSKAFLASGLGTGAKNKVKGILLRILIFIIKVVLIQIGFFAGGELVSGVKNKATGLLPGSSTESSVQDSTPGHSNQEPASSNNQPQAQPQARQQAGQQGQPKVTSYSTLDNAIIPTSNLRSTIENWARSVSSNVNTSNIDAAINDLKQRSSLGKDQSNVLIPFDSKEELLKHYKII